MAKMWTTRWLIIVATTALLAGCASPGQRTPARLAEAQAVEFLKREVPAWRRDNGCFSCHNNGDGARALLAASRKGYRIPARTLAETIAWVTEPARWDHNKGDPGFNDRKLADVQFASTLLAAVDAGRAKGESALGAAAARLLPNQDATGAWPIGEKTALGLPATWGTPLATHMALRVLKRARAPGTEEAIRKGERWLTELRPDNLPAAAALVFAFADNDSDAATRQRKAALDLMRRGQVADGGWGPYADAPTEVFDTAIVMLALAEIPSTTETDQMIRRGRRYLIEQQLGDGSWPPTTRPSGGDSYAERLSTTGWATLALLATRE